MNPSTEFKVCILSAGIGSRNTVFQNLHKSLLPLGNKATISRIIDNFPEETSFVIAVGHKKDQVMNYLNIAKPNTDITYIEVENYKDKGSGPGWSLLQCREQLQCPFIFLGSDTFFDFSENNISLDKNGLGFGTLKWNNNAGTYCMYSDKKGFYYDRFDNTNYNSKKCFVGIAGIKDYKTFWSSLAIPEMINNEHQVLSGFKNLKSIKKINFNSWRDTGNNVSYQYVLNEYSNIVEPKPDEIIFIEGKKVLKYFDDDAKAKNRVERSKILGKIVPDVELIDNNIYSYDYVPGRRLSDVNSETKLSKFFDFVKEIYLSNKEKKENFIMADFIDNCNKMYKEKTLARISQHKQLKFLDSIKIINGVTVPKINYLIDKIDWEKINKTAIPVRLHGDMSPENIIFNDKNEKYTLIDWRDKFGNDLIYGDLYYDLCKLDHALLVNGEVVRKKLYDISFDHKKIESEIWIHQKSNLLNVRNLLCKFCKENNLSFSHIQFLTALTLLNISSCHSDDRFNMFLFLYGKLLLNQHFLEEKQ